MPGTFKLEIEIVLDDRSEATVIELARHLYGCRTGAMASHSQGQPLASPEGFIVGPEDALLELLGRNPALSQAGLEIEHISCESAGNGPDAGYRETKAGASLPLTDGTTEDDEQDADEEELDDFDSGLYLCRWPNGEFSVVKADTKREAILELDEWAGAEPAWLVPMETCMIDFRLNDRAEIELGEFGEETAGFIWESCYPKLDELLSSHDVLWSQSGERNPKLARRIRKAVQHERTRLWNPREERSSAKTDLGRELQKRLGTVGPVADHYVEKLADGIMRGKSGEAGKPN
jgi:hypothetical protein